MNDTGSSSAGPVFIESPQHPNLQRLLEYWNLKRGTRWAPTRADIQPAEIKSLLADVMIWNVDKSGGPFIVRLVGENVVRFVGHNNTGKPATFGMPEKAVPIMNAVLSAVVDARAPRFRIGKALWHAKKSYRNFEACYLPLSADGEFVDMIFGGIKFDIGGLPQESGAVAKPARS